MAFIAAAVVFVASFWALAASANFDCGLTPCLPTGSSSTTSGSSSTTPTTGSTTSATTSTTSTSSSSTGSTSSDPSADPSDSEPPGDGPGLGGLGGDDDLLSGALDDLTGDEDSGGDPGPAAPPEEASDTDPTVPWIGAQLFVVAIILMGFSFGVIWFLQRDRRRRGKGPNKGQTRIGSLWR